VSLTAAEVAEIMRLVEQSGFDELTLEMDGVKLSLRRGGVAVEAPADSNRPAAPAAPGTSARAPAPSTAAPADAPGSPTSTPAAESTRADPNVQDVVAPMLGTFYRAPKPGAPPFVEIGATVAEDTIIAIIEVMKLMNTVRAGVRGTVTEVLPADGALVEYGETLIRVRRTS
jgi:acetyl-CoA carboxylase biotin carboxyl carrier protein